MRELISSIVANVEYIEMSHDLHTNFLINVVFEEVHKSDFVADVKYIILNSFYTI